MLRSYIEAIDRPTVLYVLYNMVTVRTFVSNREQLLKSTRGRRRHLHSASAHVTSSAGKDGAIRHCDVTTRLLAEQRVPLATN